MASPTLRELAELAGDMATNSHWLLSGVPKERHEMRDWLKKIIKQTDDWAWVCGQWLAHGETYAHPESRVLAAETVRCCNGVRRQLTKSPYWRGARSMVEREIDLLGLAARTSSMAVAAGRTQAEAGYLARVTVKAIRKNLFRARRGMGRWLAYSRLWMLASNEHAAICEGLAGRWYRVADEFVAGVMPRAHSAMTTKGYNVVGVEQLTEMMKAVFSQLGVGQVGGEARAVPGEQRTATEPRAATPSQFSVTEDGRSANWGRETFRFTPAQGAIIRVLWAEYRGGNRWLSSAEIQRKIDQNDNRDSFRIRDTFKSGEGPKCLDRMLVTDGKGMWRVQPPKK